MPLPQAQRPLAATVMRQRESRDTQLATHLICPAVSSCGAVFLTLPGMLRRKKWWFPSTIRSPCLSCTVLLLGCASPLTYLSVGEGEGMSAGASVSVCVCVCVRARVCVSGGGGGGRCVQ